MRNRFFASTAVIAVGLGSFGFFTPAFAQGAAEAADETGIGDIVVTAQRREESAQKAAIAIDAVSGDDLAQRGVTSAVDITKTVPALSVPSGGGNIASVFVRGVGNITTSSWVDPAVNPNYDGVVLGRGGGLLGAAFFDLQRVEVLKGPQGILYGRNATGGAINVIPARPQLGNTGAGFNLGYGNFDALSGDAYVNVATGETSALRVGGAYLKHDGYMRDGTDDAKRGSARAQFLIEPSSDLSVRLAADYTHLGGKGPGGTYLGSFLPNGRGGYNFLPTTFGPSEGFNTAAANAYRTTVLGAPGFGFLRPLNRESKLDTTYWGVNAEINVSTGIGKLTVIPAYRNTKDRTFFNGPAFNTANTSEDIDQYSFESRLAGNSGMIDYVVGGYYFNERVKANNQFNQEFVLPIVKYRLKTESWAAFGQLTAKLSDKFRLIGGARYTHDNKNIDGIINNFITFCGGIPPVPPPASFGVGGPGGCAAPTALPRYPNFLSTTDTLQFLIGNGWIPANSTLTPTPQVFPVLSGRGLILKTHNPVVDSGNFSRLTWKVSAEYDVGPSSLLYATAESGYHSGGFQMAEGKPRYKPEYITAFTIGSKNRFMDNKLQANFEAFYWRYRDQQITYFTVDTSGTLINSTENAGRGTVKGFDVDLIAKPANNTTLSAKLQYLDTKYTDLHLFTAAPRDNFACPFKLTGQIAGGAPVKDFNCSGYSFLFSPKFTMNLGVEQVIPLGSSLELVGSVDTAYRGKQWGAFERLNFERIASYWTTDLSLSVRNPDGGWSVTGYLLNLEDKRRNVAPQSSPIGVAVGHYTPPMTYGVRVSAKF